MPSELSILATRVRDFISICAEETPFGQPVSDPAWFAHHDAEFNGLALMLFTLQFTHNASYRKLCEARKLVPHDVHHWTRIPALPTAAFKEMELTSLSPQERTTIFHSSGTTGQKPSRNFHSAGSLAVYEASLWPWFLRNVLPDYTPFSGSGQTSSTSPYSLLILTPPSSKVPHSSLVHMFEVIRQRLAAPDQVFVGTVAHDGAWILNRSATVWALEESVASGQSLLLLSTAFALVHLLEYLTEQNLQLALPSGSRVVETGGYKGRSRAVLKSELYSQITRRLGIPADHIIGEYGMSELSSQAYDSEFPDSKDRGVRQRIFQFPPWTRARIVSPETGQEVADGETGWIRVIDLANVFSVMAIQTEDLGIRRGAGFELMGRTEAAEPRGCSLMSVDSPL